MKSWKKGLRKVSLTKAIMEHTTKSLAQAKADTDRLLDGETVTLDLASESERDEFKRKAEEFGVEFD